MATNETDSIFLIDSKEAAFVLGISSRTLANWRCKGRGPAYIRLGKKRSPVMYRVSDVQDWIVEHQVRRAEMLADRRRKGREVKHVPRRP